VLNKKIMNAKMANDTKKISELQSAERTMAYRSNKIVQRISAIRQKYPELQPAEKPGAESSGEVSVNEEKPKAEGANIVYHEVEMGDTLISISRKYFGSPNYYRQIAEMNNITDIGNISQGTRLMIDLNMAGGKVVPAESGIVYHVVVPGDTLMSISRKYFNGSASYYKEIAEMNGIAGTGLKVGTKLKIDKGLMKKAKPPL
jgi:nucleoid-associated protein YgaU